MSLSISASVFVGQITTKDTQYAIRIVRKAHIKHTNLPEDVFCSVCGIKLIVEEKYSMEIRGLEFVTASTMEGEKEYFVGRYVKWVGLRAWSEVGVDELSEMVAEVDTLLTRHNLNDPAQKTAVYLLLEIS